MTNNNRPSGHISAFITILIWGTTFISTKLLLNSFAPIEILFIRFSIGYLALWLVQPHRLFVKAKSQEFCFALAGLCGVTLYYLFENIALTYTLASHVGVIISIAPFFTAIIGWLFLHSERPGPRFLIGFVIAMLGIGLISLQNETDFALNPLGDLLAVAAAIIWAVYSTLAKKISTFGYPTIQATRRTFFYGLLFMIPVVLMQGFSGDFLRFTDAINLVNLLFLGLGASALCFVTWNYAVKLLGSVKTSIYIYMVPVITAVTSALILGERITIATVWGILLTLTGLLLSESKGRALG
jgi:drug/metabolite transporter (DMT)-like permease